MLCGAGHVVCGAGLVVCGAGHVMGGHVVLSMTQFVRGGPSVNMDSFSDFGGK